MDNKIFQINSCLPTCPLREEKSFSQRAFSIYTDIRKLQDKAKTSSDNPGSIFYISKRVSLVTNLKTLTMAGTLSRPTMFAMQTSMSKLTASGISSAEEPRS
ncbi:hypothetical protein ACTNEA_08235 [Oscillospiraceae bacterium HCP3S3_F4]